jgi:peroxiredoxin
MAVEIGQPAPDFSLPDQSGSTVSLADVRATKPVVLVFYPFTFTGICEGELCSLRDDIARYESAGVQLLAVACDSRFAQTKWAQEEGYTFPLLSDFWPHGATAQAYGVFNDEKGCAIRATFVIGTDGTVVDAFHTDSLGTAREQARYEEALAKL